MCVTSSIKVCLRTSSINSRALATNTGHTRGTYLDIHEENRCAPLTVTEFYDLANNHLVAVYQNISKSNTSSSVKDRLTPDQH